MEQVSNLETLHSKQTVLTTGIQSPSKIYQLDFIVLALTCSTTMQQVHIG